MPIETECPVCGSVNCGCYAAAPYRGLCSREEDESNIRHGQADTEDVQAQKSKIDLSGLPPLPPGSYAVCQCESMPGEEKWRFVKGLDINADAGGGSITIYACNFCGKEVIV